MQQDLPTTELEQTTAAIDDKEFIFKKLWYVTDINEKLLRIESAQYLPEPINHKIIDTFTHYVELHQGDLFINGVRVGPRKRFIDIRLVDDEVQIHYLKNYSFLDDPDYKRDFLNTWTDGSNKVFPIKIGDRVVGSAIGDIENGDYEFSIHDRDFLLKLNQEPVESRPNDNDRSLHWRSAKYRSAHFLKSLHIFPFSISEKAKQVLLGEIESSKDEYFRERVRVNNVITDEPAWRFDITATWLHSHPDCVNVSPDFDLIQSIADELEVDTSQVTLNPKFLPDIKVLNIGHRAYLVWWKDIFIAQVVLNYYMDGRACVEFVNRKFWDDFTSNDQISKNYIECEDDIKIRIITKYRNYLVENNLHLETINDFYACNIYPKPPRTFPPQSHPESGCYSEPGIYFARKF